MSAADKLDRLESRTLLVAHAEIRVEQRDGQRIIVGYAMKFDVWSEDLGGFIERVRPGCFTRCLTSPDLDVRFLVNHNRDLILGRTRSKTLRLFEDATGLGYELNPPDSSLADHYVTAVERGDISGMSFRFYAQKDAWDFASEPARRDLIDVDIDDVCLATYPAYPDSTAAVRSLEDHRRSQPRRTPRRDRAGRLLQLAEAV